MPRDVSPIVVGWDSDSPAGKMALRRRMAGGWPAWALMAWESGRRRRRAELLADMACALRMNDPALTELRDRMADAVRNRKADARTFRGFALTVWQAAFDARTADPSGPA